MNRARLSAVVVAVGAWCSAEDVSAQSSTLTRMRVGYHGDEDGNLPWNRDTFFDNGFAQASTALQNDNPSIATDEVCNLTLAREGTWWFTGPSNSPNTEALYRGVQANAADAYMAIVGSIGWCDWQRSVDGCGNPIGWGMPFLVRTGMVTHAAHGIIYAHEYGHTVGLSHNFNGSMVMDGNALGTGNTGVNATECSGGFRFSGWSSTCPGDNSGSSPVICDSGSGGGARAASAGRPSLLAPIDEEERDLSRTTIAELARAPMIDSVPVEAEDFYGPADVAILKDMLRNPKEQPSHHRIVTLIGLISDGADSDVAAVEEYVDRANADPFAGHYALGYLVARANSQRALSRLLKDVALSGKRAEVAASGLSLSGHEQATAAIGALQSRGVADSQFVALLTRQHQEVRAGGLRGLYKAVREPILAAATPGRQDAGRSSSGEAGAL